MANTITTQTIINGSRNLTIKVHIVGDGSGDEIRTNILNASDYDTEGVKITEISAYLVSKYTRILHIKEVISC